MADVVPTITAHEYVRTVYTDATGYLDSYNTANGVQYDVYTMIDKMSPITGSRLRQLGAHPDSGRFDKTYYLVDHMMFSSTTVPRQWLNDWATAIKPQTAGLYKKTVIEKTLDDVKPYAASASKTLLFYGLIVYIALDMYGEGKKRAVDYIST